MSPADSGCGRPSHGSSPALIAALDEELAAADRRLAVQTRTRELLADLRERVVIQATMAG